MTGPNQGFTHIISFNPYNHSEASIMIILIILILKMKPKVREVKRLAEVHKQAVKHRNASRQPTRTGDLNHSSYYSELKLLNMQLVFYWLS